jgi:hypothetical protein
VPCERGRVVGGADWPCPIVVPDWPCARANEPGRRRAALRGLSAVAREQAACLRSPRRVYARGAASNFFRRVPRVAAKPGGARADGLEDARREHHAGDPVHYPWTKSGAAGPFSLERAVARTSSTAPASTTSTPASSADALVRLRFLDPPSAHRPARLRLTSQADTPSYRRSFGRAEFHSARPFATATRPFPKETPP